MNRRKRRTVAIVLASLAVGVLVIASFVYRVFQDGMAFERLSAAARRGDIHGMEAVLAQGYSVDISDGETENNPLLSAARAGRLDSVNFLLAHGADVNHQDYYFDQTALLLTDVPEVAQTLLAHGANPNTTSKLDRRTPLFNWAATGDQKVVLLLLQYGANPTVKNSDGKTPAEVATASGHAGVAKALRAAEVVWKKTH